MRSKGQLRCHRSPLLGYATSPSSPLPRSPIQQPRRHRTNPNTGEKPPPERSPRGHSPGARSGACMTAPSAAAGSTLVLERFGASLRSAASIGGTTTSGTEATSMAHAESARICCWAGTHTCAAFCSSLSLAGRQLDGSCCALQIARPLLSPARNLIEPPRDAPSAD